MELKITCPLRWREAQAKAEELNDRSLNDCIMRLLSWVTPWQEDIDKAKAYYEKVADWHFRLLGAKWHFESIGDPVIIERANAAYRKMYPKFDNAQKRYLNLEIGGTSYIKISQDHEPYSFLFGEYNEDDKLICNGGIIFYNDKWHIHT